jgi:L-alanine-DL-glutamate epimerase-like enolase superfamily enzyme
MEIMNVEGIILRLPHRRAVADGTHDDLLIRIETDEGITGYGEVDTSLMRIAESSDSHAPGARSPHRRFGR